MSSFILHNMMDYKCHDSSCSGSYSIYKAAIEHTLKSHPNSEIVIEKHTINQNCEDQWNLVRYKDVIPAEGLVLIDEQNIKVRFKRKKPQHNDIKKDSIVNYSIEK